MDCYFTLCHNAYGYSLLFYKVYIRRENVGSWNSGLEKEQILETYSAQLQKSWNSTECLKRNKEKSTPKMKARGPTPCPWGWGVHPPLLGRAPLPRGPPGGSPTPIFSHMKSFDEKKTEEKLSGRDSAATRRNHGGTNLGLWQSCSAGDTSLQEGEIITIVITNAPLIRRGQSPSTSSPAPSHLQTLVHLLYPILVSKSGIGACRLLVVLITPCSWC